MPETRKVAAILVADIVGYSRLAGAEEERTLARLRSLRSDLIDPTIADPQRSARQAHWRWRSRRVPQRGRGGAMRHRRAERACASATPAFPADQRIEVRVGIHLGDVVEEADGDLMGDGVNVAARLQAICQAGRHLPFWRRIRAGARQASSDVCRSRRAEPQEHRAASPGVCGEAGRRRQCARDAAQSAKQGPRMVRAGCRSRRGVDCSGLVWLAPICATRARPSPCRGCGGREARARARACRSSCCRSRT